MRTVIRFSIYACSGINYMILHLGDHMPYMDMIGIN